MKGLRSLRITTALLPILWGLLVAQTGCTTDGSAQPETHFHTPKSRPVPVAQIDEDAIENEPIRLPSRRAPRRPSWSDERFQHNNPRQENTPAIWIEEDDGDAILQPIDFPMDENQDAFPSTDNATYIVQAGDSLWVIAKRHGISLNELIQANGLDRNAVIKVGQTLTIPGGSQSSHAGLSRGTQGDSYIVGPGDTLSKIAKQHDVSLGALKAVNGLNSDRILIGQSLNIPTHSSPVHVNEVTSAPTPSVSQSIDGPSYTVQPGDTLGSIAKRSGTSVRNLKALNGISDPRKLRVGQTLALGDNAHSIDSSLPVSTRPAQGDDVLGVPVLESQTAPEALMVESASVEQASPLAHEADTMDEDDMLFELTEQIPVVTIQHDSPAQE